jgi:F-type H+-transporting ATPase subunit epsilon
MAMADVLRLCIISPEKIEFDGEVQRVNLPGASGAFTILPHHAPIVSSLVAGRIVYEPTEGGEQSVDINAGFIEMSDNTVSVCIS